MKKVALISSYCNTDEKIKVLEKNIETVKSQGLDVIVISPLPLPEVIQKKSDYLFIMKDNPVLDWPKKAMYAWRFIKIKGVNFKITKTYPDYGWAGLYHVKKLSEIGLSFNYDYFYHMIYDLKINDSVINALHQNLSCNIFPSKRGNEVWEAGLHFMSFDRNNLQKFINHITIENYLSIPGGHAFSWLSKLKESFNYQIINEPVEDEIYYYEGLDFFNVSPIPNLKFFIEKNDQYDGTIKILFYDIDEEKEIILTINENGYKLNFSENILVDLGFDKYIIGNVNILHNNVDYNITSIIESIKHTTIVQTSI